MTIGEYIALRQPNIFNKLMLICGFRRVKAKKKPASENYAGLMRHDSYKRVGGSIKQRRWS